MTTKAMNLTKTLTLGRIEKQGLTVTGILVIVNALLGSRELAIGAAAGGILAVVSFLATKLVVNALIANVYSKGLSMFILLIKMAVLIGIVVCLFIFTKVNIYGFLIGLTGVVLVIFVESLRGKKDGTL